MPGHVQAPKSVRRAMGLAAPKRAAPAKQKPASASQAQQSQPAEPRASPAAAPPPAGPPTLAPSPFPATPLTGLLALADGTPAPAAPAQEGSPLEEPPKSAAKGASSQHAAAVPASPAAPAPASVNSEMSRLVRRLGAALAEGSRNGFGACACAGAVSGPGGSKAGFRPRSCAGGVGAD